jgi:16S rRNA (adenine1518-N6/adenine1519-N6)-dimethyltransferase
VTIFRPKKSLGQNFLVDPVHRARIVAAAELVRADVVLEIGAGDGSLTSLIASQAGRVIAVELDQRLIPGLKERFAAQPEVKVLHGDILAVDVGEVMGSSNGGSVHTPSRETAEGLHFKVVANLPYYITAAVIRKLLELPEPPDLLVLTVQREVAERIVASPPHMNLLAVSVQFYCTAEIVDHIPAGAFRPSPKVESAVVRLTRRRKPLFPHLHAGDFFKVVRAGFYQPRKQIRNSLVLGMRSSPDQATSWLQVAEVLPQRRAETLTLQEWGSLSKAVIGEGQDSPFAIG